MASDKALHMRNWKRQILEWFKRRRSTAKMLGLHDLSKHDGYLEELGWFDSFQRSMAIDRQQGAIPWLTYPAIAFIEPRLHNDMRLFEFGSGNSTIWWARHVGEVVSCEHNPAWHEQMAPRLPPNVNYLYVELDNGYSEAIRRYREEFDVLVVDGRERVQCIRNSLGALKSGGVVIWDNSEREKYRPGFEFLRDAGFRRIDFWGMGPIYAVLWCTTVFYRQNNCFGI